MEQEIKEIKSDVKDIKTLLTEFRVSQSERVTRLETVQKGFITLSTSILTGIILYLTNILGEY